MMVDRFIFSKLSNLHQSKINRTLIFRSIT